MKEMRTALKCFKDEMFYWCSKTFRLYVNEREAYKHLWLPDLRKHHRQHLKSTKTLLENQLFFHKLWEWWRLINFWVFLAVKRVKRSFSSRNSSAPPLPHNGFNLLRLLWQNLHIKRKHILASSSCTIPCQGIKLAQLDFFHLENGGKQSSAQ